MTEAIAVLDYVLTSSSELTAWALGIGAGSVAAVLGTSYHRPGLLRYRLIYLLFIPGWVCIALSLMRARELSSSYLASKMVGPDALHAIASAINDLYGEQQSQLLLALGFFSLWLVLYLLFWIFVPAFPGGEGK